MRLLLKAVLLIALLLLGGFFVFVAMLPRESRFDAVAVSKRLGDIPTSETGIVVFTGGGGARIDRAAAFYRLGVADRILISGTHPKVTKRDLVAVADPDLLDCCTDLGPNAQTTIGNAIEARDWTRDRGYRAIYLVTNDYHLPRATVEMRHASPDLVVIGVPVETERAREDTWYRSGTARRLLFTEYGKFLLAWCRSLS